MLYFSLDDSQDGKSDLFSDADSLVVVAGNATAEIQYHKSTALQLALFGYQIPDTVLVLTKDTVYFLAGGKKAKLVEACADAARDEAGKTLRVLAKGKTDDAAPLVQVCIRGLPRWAAASVDTLRLEPPQELLAAVQGAGPKTGVLKSKEAPEGKLIANWLEVAQGLDTVDVTAGLSAFLSERDEGQVLNSRKAAHLAASAVEHMVQTHVEKALDSGKAISLEYLSKEADAVLHDPKGKMNVRLKTDSCDIAFTPSFQSGGSYQLKLAGSTDGKAKLHPGCIVVSLGARYDFYCGMVTRTYLVDPTEAQEREYKALLAAQEAMAKALTAGALLSAVYEAGVAAVRAAGAEHLVDLLPKNLGFATGLEVRLPGRLVHSLGFLD